MRCCAAAAEACGWLRARLCRRDVGTRARRQPQLCVSRSGAACRARDDRCNRRVGRRAPSARPLLADGVSRRADPFGGPLSTRALELRLRHASGRLRPAIQPPLRVEHVVHGVGRGAPHQRGGASTAAPDCRGPAVAARDLQQRTGARDRRNSFDGRVPRPPSRERRVVRHDERRAPKPGRCVSTWARAAVHPGGARFHTA